MKKLIIVLIIFTCTTSAGKSQNWIYTESGGELLFSFADVRYQGTDMPVNLRFSMFFHINEKIHFDFTEFLGIYSGLSLRNIGYITDYNDIRMKRRTYSLGMPLALKLGSFKDHLYVYGGGSYELFFHYKQKKFVDGNKSKFSEWFSPRTNRLAPSLFFGMKFPGGVNLQFRYYPQDFLNRNFRGYDFGEATDYSDYSKSKLFYISLSFNFKDKLIEKKDFSPSREVRMATL